ncbi:MAG: hypothetical protein CK429_06195 [Mycobacterium sp.]|nr:MAG: hypothetical protein CK429_06195 [Mycobacterium sp.]PJE24007.1 MAG: hypothetical protein CK431_08350 [Mycobacterium sp.]
MPHYDARAAVEHWIDMMRSDEFMAKATDGWYSHHVSVLVTGPYFENLQTTFAPRHGQLSDGRDGVIFEITSGRRQPLFEGEHTGVYFAQGGHVSFDFT